MATTTLYVIIIESQPSYEFDARRVVTVAVALATCALLGTFASWAPSPKLRSVLFAIPAGALIGLGFLAIFSIGLLLLVAGALFVVATAKACTEAGLDSAGVAVFVGAITLVVAPLLLLWVA